MNRATDDEFIACWNRNDGRAPKVAVELGIALRNVLTRRRKIEGRTGEPLLAASSAEVAKQVDRSYSRRVGLEVEDGTVIVFSDAHYSINGQSRAHRGLLKLIKQLKPVAVIANGDILDGSSISRHDPDGWTKQPTVNEELKVVVERMDEVAKAARKAFNNVRLLRTRGNHDFRFDVKLASVAPQYRGVQGMSLADHLPDWKEAVSIMVNERAATPTMVKHRWHNGIHATYNNLLKGGINIVTGHLHRLKVEAWGDYRGRRYAVDTGTLADIDQEEFAYTEDNAVPWGSGFAVLTFRGGELLPPELAEVMADGLVFRATVYEV